MEFEAEIDVPQKKKQQQQQTNKKQNMPNLTLFVLFCFCFSSSFKLNVLTEDWTYFFLAALSQRCYHCLEDAGSGDDLALCNNNQISLPCSYRQFPSIGEGQCFTAAGRYKYLNGSEVIHTGIARGCIDCKGKRIL